MLVVDSVVGCVVGVALQDFQDLVWWPVPVAGVVEGQEEFEVVCCRDGQGVCEQLVGVGGAIAGVQGKGVDLGCFGGADVACPVGLGEVLGVGELGVGLVGDAW